ncbi:MAG TPA: protein kinase, partial [Steroidobacteraceae bacterium]|nr:protein kinase [Steroidobacteraceae bacterium]
MPQVRAAAQPTTLGRYTLIERLGIGGQGEVWRAHDESRGVDIALKILAPSAARNPAAWAVLEREHSISSRLQHPGILQILPPERLQDVIVLPMELASGGDLRRLRGAGYLEIVPVLLEAAEALEYAHARGVVHRDLKPGNVLFDGRGRVKIADFGVAALLPSAAAGAAERGAGLSPFTASPEQLRDEPPSAADDVYGLGALAYELLSGHPPYYPNFDLRRAQTQPVPELVPTRQIPPELGELVMRMLAKRAADRPASMQQVMDELDATLNATLSFAPEGVETDDADHPEEAAAIQPAVREVREAPVPRGVAPPAALEPERALRPETRLPTGVAEERPQRRQMPAAVATPIPADPGLRRQRDEPLAATARPRPAAKPAAAAAVPQPDPAAEPRIPPRPMHFAPQRRPDPRQPAPGLAPPVAPVPQDDPFRLRVEHPPLRATPPGGGRARPAASYGGRRPRRWPYLVSGLLCGAALICGATAAALFWLPRQDLARLQSLLASAASIASPRPAMPAAPAAAPDRMAAQPASLPAPKPQADPAAIAQLRSARAAFDKRAASLQARGAPVWDGAEFSAARMQAAESSGAAAAGGVALAVQHLEKAQQLLDNVARKAPQALAAQLKAGDAALAAGHRDVADQAYALARRIDPNSKRAVDGARRSRLLSGVLPLLKDAQKAESARNYSRAAQDFSQALALDPGNAAAKAGLARANAAFGDDNYARAVGAGFAALGAGRLQEAQADFQQALGFRSRGAEAIEGLQRVSAALRAGRIAALRQRAASLEAQEHWRQAIAVYDDALREEPSLAFAKRGKARDEARAELSESLQRIIDHPDRLAFPSTRDEAVTLLQEAREQTPAGPVLQSLVERLDQLLPQLDRPVLLNLVSDNATQVTIPSIGVFGAFGRREIRLKPGTYTVIGTRDGYRAVHQEFTVEPGQQSVTINVSCS